MNAIISWILSQVRRGMDWWDATQLAVRHWFTYPVELVLQAGAAAGAALWAARAWATAPDQTFAELVSGQGMMPASLNHRLNDDELGGVFKGVMQAPYTMRATLATAVGDDKSYRSIRLQLDPNTDFSDMLDQAREQYEATDSPEQIDWLEFLQEWVLGKINWDTGFAP